MASAKSEPKDGFIEIELNPASGVDVLGADPLLWEGMSRDFTQAEADALLALRNEHGTPICRIVTPGETSDSDSK